MGRKINVPHRQANAIEAMLTKARDLDVRRQNQIANQIDAINRLAGAQYHDKAWEYDDEMKELHEQLAAAQAATDSALERVRQLEEESMGKRKDAFLAGFAAGETEDDANEAWSEYKEGLETEATEDDTDSE